MGPNYHPIKTQIRDLDQQARRLRREELRGVLVDLRSKILEYGITAEQLFGSDLSDLVRYRDPQTGKTWNGLGRPPNWIRGKDREAYRVKRPEPS